MDANKHPCTCQMCMPVISFDPDRVEVRIESEAVDQATLDRFFRERRNRERERHDAHHRALVSRN